MCGVTTSPTLPPVSTELFKTSNQTPRLECVIKNYFSYLSTGTFIVCTQKNCLDQMVLLCIQNIV